MIASNEVCPKQHCKRQVINLHIYTNLPNPCGNFFFEDEHSDTLQNKNNKLQLHQHKHLQLDWTFICSIVETKLCFICNALI